VQVRLQPPPWHVSMAQLEPKVQFMSQPPPVQPPEQVDPPEQVVTHPPPQLTSQLELLAQLVLHPPPMQLTPHVEL
jgi:hypothetical protein